MTIASLTAATTAPSTAPKGSASPVPAAAPDSQTTPDTPVPSNLEMAVAAARQSAAARQDGLSMLMANLLRATAAGSLPTPVQQAVDQLLALHLPTDVAPDATAVKTALLTSGLFTEANFASNSEGVPVDIKTALLQLNTAAENWLTRTASSAPNAPSQPTTPSPAQPTTAPTAGVSTPPAVRAGQTVPIAAPPSPARRAAPRTSEIPAGKPTAPNAPAPQRSGQMPIAPNAPSDAAPEAETIKSAIGMLGQITQVLKASGTVELPKEIKAALVLVRNAIAPSPAASPIAASEAPTLKTALPAMTTPATPVQPAPSPEQHPLPNTSTAPIAKPAMPQVQPQTPQASQAAASGFAPRGSSPVEQLLALQLAPTPSPAPAADVLPEPAPVVASPSLGDTSEEPVRATDTVPAPTTPRTTEPSNTFAAKPEGPKAAPSPAMPSSTSPSSGTPASGASPSAAPSSVAPSSAAPSLGAAPRFTPQAAPSLPNDAKTLLTLLAGAVEAMPPRPSSAAAAPQLPDVSPQPTPQPNTQPPADVTAAIATLSNAGLLAPPSSGVPNDLKTLLSLFNMVVESWLPQATSAAGTAGTPSVPPPVRGAASKAQPAALATLPENADPVATAKQLLSGSDAALARQTLLQIASLPDAAPQSRDARWMFDLPLMTAQGPAVAQMIIERDGSGTSAETPTPVWRVQFAIDIEPLGPVRANLALSGDRAWVTISADRPESLDKLQSGVSWLADALQSNALDADIAFQPSLPPQRGAAASRFMDHAS